MCSIVYEVFVNFLCDANNTGSQLDFDFCSTGISQKPPDSSAAPAVGISLISGDHALSLFQVLLKHSECKLQYNYRPQNLISNPL